MKLTTIRLFAAIPFVLVGTALSTTLAAADAPTELTSATVPSPPPAEFAPMTRSERLATTWLAWLMAKPFFAQPHLPEFDRRKTVRKNGAAAPKRMASASAMVLQST